MPFLRVYQHLGVSIEKQIMMLAKEQTPFHIFAIQLKRLTKISAVHLTIRQWVKQSKRIVPLCWLRYTCSSGKRWPILLLALRLEGRKKDRMHCNLSMIQGEKKWKISMNTYGSLFSCDPNIIIDFKAFQSCRTRSSASWANRGGSKSWSGISESAGKHELDQRKQPPSIKVPPNRVTHPQDWLFSDSGPPWCEAACTGSVPLSAVRLSAPEIAGGARPWRTEHEREAGKMSLRSAEHFPRVSWNPTCLLFGRVTRLVAVSRR